MNFDFGKKMIYDMMKEQQMKLGYEQETVRLYIPVQSLKHILGFREEISKEEQKEEIGKFRIELEKTLGDVKITGKGERLCIAISPEGSRYVHENIEENPFLADMIALFRKHHITIEDVKEVFETYSQKYVCLEQDGVEFDYLLYFEDKKIDEYFYCVKFDEGHASYHRFLEEDIRDLFGEMI